MAGRKSEYMIARYWTICSDREVHKSMDPGVVLSKYDLLGENQSDPGVN